MKSSVIAFEREMEKEYYAAGSLCCCFLKQANVLTIHLRLYDYFYNISVTFMEHSQGSVSVTSIAFWLCKSLCFVNVPDQSPLDLLNALLEANKIPIEMLHVNVTGHIVPRKPTSVNCCACRGGNKK